MTKGIRPMRGKVQIRYQHKGSRYSDTLDLRWSEANIEEAARIREERIQRLRSGLPPVEEPAPVEEPETECGLTFAQVAQEYLDHALTADEDDDFKLQLSSRNSNRDLLNLYWLGAIGNMPIERITLDDLKAAARSATWPSKKTKKNAYSAVRQVFVYAEDEGREHPIKTNPATALTTTTKKKRRTKKPGPDTYSAEDRDTLLNWLKANTPAHVYTYFLVAFYSGMRTGELLALTWADYDGKSLMVTKARVRGVLTTTKTEEERRVLMPDWVCRVINTLPSRFKQRELFINQLGNPYSKGFHLNEHFDRAHRETGVKRSKQPNYPWRHTYASIGLSNKAQPAFLAKQLGHTLAVFYSTYATSIASDKDRETIEDAFSEPGSGRKNGREMTTAAPETKE